MNKKLMAIAFAGAFASSQLSAFSETDLRRALLLHRFNDARIIDETTCAEFTAMKLSDAKKLIRVDLKLADLARINLMNANLSLANLAEASLYGAILKNANLTDSNMFGAILVWADLSGANLTGADLGDVVWQWAELRGTNFAGAKNMSDEFKAYAKGNGAINVPE